jgi:hypothetical protein
MNLINDLFDAGIITADDAQLLTAQLPAGAGGSTLLTVLHSFLLDKAFADCPKGSFTVTLYNTDNDTKISDTDVAKTNNLLDILYAHQIINKQVYQKLLAYAVADTPEGYITILHLAQKLTAYSENFTIEQQLAFADILLGERKPMLYNGILNEDQFKILKDDIQSGKLNTYLDFFNYSYCCHSISIQEAVADCQVIKLMMPVLNEMIYDSFSIKNIIVKETKNNGHPTFDDRQVKLLLDISTRKYEHSFTCTRNARSNKISNRKLVENILLLINDILTEFAAPYRFTAITNRHKPQIFPAYDDRYVFCRLSMQQLSILDFYTLQQRSLFNQPLPVFQEVLSYRRIEYIIYHFRARGLLDHLSEQVIYEVVANLQESTYQNADHLLAKFPDTVTVVGRYVTPNQPPYLQILPALGAMSNGLLNFTDIEDHTPTSASVGDELEYNVSFRCNNIHHTVKCQYYYGEFDESVLFYLSNEILKQHYPDLILLNLIFKGINHNAYKLIRRKQLDYLALANIKLGITRF